MVDALFADPRLAPLYDALDADRRDLSAYVALAAEFGAATVLDIGCGTGTLACLLADRGLSVTALDPAAASLAVARSKPGAERVRWLHGYPADLPPLAVDLATMTGNVAQVFLTDEEWTATLRSVREALRPGGRLIFETRDPAAQAWLDWTPEKSHRRAAGVRQWHEITGVGDGLVSFESTIVFEAEGTRVTSTSTLRFRTRAEIADSLARAGYRVEEVREAPDRPGLEMVFIATTPG
ncbi:class I SAM-dependent methyltransferase [Asanoa sp. NPDC049573]|uniref:class I SAM-dependent methyltransferase n=1 Tax=Asanoa sp. NPDC049573 TaxID=3155396 RepID=UPI003413574E